jgi:CHAT domain-containing protein/tetratricopeptide (TPR) repeat protein
VASSRQTFRVYLEEKLFGEWAAAVEERHESQAACKLALAKSIADALVATGGDRMAADTIAQIELLLKQDTARLRQLIAGFASYYRGLAFVDSNMISRALARFQFAHQALVQQGSPFALWAAYRVAACRYQIAGYQEAQRETLALLNTPASRPYRALRGRALSLEGLIEGIEGNQNASTATYEAAEASFSDAHESPLVARTRGILAIELFVLGQDKDAWRRLYPALIDPTTFGMPEIRSALNTDAAALAYDQGETEIALWFQDEVLRDLRLMRRPEGIVGALCFHASLLAALGKGAAAQDDLVQARISLNQVADLALRHDIEGDLLLAEGELAATRSPQEAIAKLDEAIPIFRGTSYHYRIGQALYERALAEKALDQKDAAERDLGAAIAESERQRKTIGAAGDRISYLDRMKEIFDTMIGLQLERQRSDSALRFSEQAKARVLWDWMLTRPAHGSGSSHLPPTATPLLDVRLLQRGLPEGTAVIEYAVLPSKTVLWVFHRHGEVWSGSVDIGTDRLSDLVQQLRRSVVNRHPSELEAISKQLYDKLIRPSASHIAPGERLVLIPDGVLHTLPFPLLRDRQTGRYLIQDHTCAVAPSARTFMASLRRDEDLARRPDPRVLVVTAPEFDPTVDPTLPPLKAGRTEASIAEVFPGSQVLRGSTATRDTFLRDSGDFGMLYFGGHSVVNPDFPLLSQMLFAKGSEDPTRGVLYSGDILKQRFLHTRLVVLASCNTAAGRISRTEGVESLARPFLAAGVPSVVASLWRVDDQVTADFFVRFYRHLAEGFDVPGALQATQVESLGNSVAGAADPRAWAGFEVVGGGVRDTPSAVYRQKDLQSH